MLYKLELELLIKFMVQLALLMSMDSILQQEDCGHGELNMVQVVNGQNYLEKKQYLMVLKNFGLL